ncbi:phosphate acyltransferase PlsX [Atopobacter sp. AH10]|uniref:phosphate acyltransferase PlsX n=1 Tax=Atopobacter sp. AH10 TaxID=2315861 RepID=UPI000EF260E4|nr:phosphate acyltransferase PlsX [Atopobacter sp. AH10]RLK63293.1 phosphate acyltransferase PlsX [Atopobacter sp. AH10]
MKIAIDAMGGDFAPKAVVEGTLKAAERYPEIQFILFGPEDVVREHLTVEKENISIHHAPMAIKVTDSPVKAVRTQKDSSLVMAAQAVKDGEADALMSAGNTGAVLTAGLLLIGRMKGIDRPGLMATIPSFSGDHPYTILTDAGANVDCKVKNLVQFAELATLYQEKVFGLKDVKVGLLNNGTEEGKGNSLTKAAFQLLKDSSHLDFVGNVEARDILTTSCPVIVGDGFVCNAVLKSFEGTALTLMKAIKGAIKSGPLSAQIGGLLIKKPLKNLLKQVNYDQIGGAVLLGIKAPLIKAHGSSNPVAIASALDQTVQMLTSGLIPAINQRLEELASKNEADEVKED